MKTKLFGTLVALVALAVAAPEVYAAQASLSLSPSTGVYPIGQTFTVDVRLDTGGTEVGTADATVVFDPEDLQYVAVSDDNSVFSRILVDSGTVPGRVDLSAFIERGLPSFSGANGLVAQLTFMPLRNVATELRFSQGAATPPLVFGASVGSLANILSNLNAATYTLIPRESVPAAVAYAAEPTEFEITPLPVPDHEWFGTTSVKLSWDLPTGVEEMRTAVSDDPNAVLDKVYQVPVSSVEVDGLVEGTNYFFLQFMYGTEWGPVIREKLQVDLSGPSYVVVKEEERKDSADPRVAFEIEASDELSGVLEYIVSIDGGDEEVWNGDGAYQPSELSSGEHVLTVIARDRAGNETEEDTVFLVKSLESPVLTEAPDRVLTGDSITVRGTTYPNARVTVFTSFNDGEAKEHTVESDAAGVFVATIAEASRSGKYTVWFQVTDERGAMSPLSIKRSVNVSQPYIMLFGTVAVTYLSIIVPLLGLIVLLVLVLWLGYTFLRGYRSRVRRETTEAYSIVGDEFDALRDSIRKQIGMLEKANQSRELTREEMRIFNDLSKRLDNIEEHIEQEIDDIAVRSESTEPEAHTEREESHEKAPEKPSKHTVRIERRS